MFSFLLRSLGRKILQPMCIVAKQLQTSESRCVLVAMMRRCERCGPGSIPGVDSFFTNSSVSPLIFQFIFFLFFYKNLLFNEKHLTKKLGFHEFSYAFA